MHQYFPEWSASKASFVKTGALCQLNGADTKEMHASQPLKQETTLINGCEDVFQAVSFEIVSNERLTYSKAAPNMHLTSDQILAHDAVADTLLNGEAFLKMFSTDPGTANKKANNQAT